VIEADGQGSLFELPVPVAVDGDRAAVAAGRVFVGRCSRCTAARPGKAPVGVRTVEPRFRGRLSFCSCPWCGVQVQVFRVDAVAVPGRPCDQACMVAMGAKCMCSCGGANHGRAWGNISPK
jgi:hypothetical protein